MDEKIVSAIKKARESKKRNFKQTFDLAINLKGIDLKKPENKIKTEAFLPNGFGKSVKICIIADLLIPVVNKLEDKSIILIRKDQLESLGADKKALKKVASECKSFIAEAPLMPLVGRCLGPVLAVRNKMPKPISPTLSNLKPVTEMAKNTLQVALKSSPVIHCAVGSEDMPDEKIAENIEAVLKAVKAALPKGDEQIKNFVIKLSMGKAIRVG